MLRSIIIFITMAILISSCDCKKKRKRVDSMSEANLLKKNYVYKPSDTALVEGTTYLPVYSEIYARSESRSYPLTTTVSIRNVSVIDTVFINKSEYYDTKGELIRTYFDKTIYLKPMETFEIVVAEDHEQGGSGANFMFHWSSKHIESAPLIEAIMISTSGQQGLSFTTRGIAVEEWK